MHLLNLSDLNYVSAGNKNFFGLTDTQASTLFGLTFKSAIDVLISQYLVGVTSPELRPLVSAAGTALALFSGYTAYNALSSTRR